MTETLVQPGVEENNYDSRMLREKAVAAKAAVADLAGEVKHYAADRFGKLKARSGEKLHDANESVVGFVQNHPYKSLAIVAGLGVALGLLLHRRR